MSLNSRRFNEQLQNLKTFGRFLYFWRTRMTTIGKSFEKTRRELIGIIYFIIIYVAQYFVVGIRANDYLLEKKNTFRFISEKKPYISYIIILIIFLNTINLRILLPSRGGHLIYRCPLNARPKLL